ncbi:uncharacterized protein LOC127701413 [Mytilus californianus]|uniref:uncharacterized protein LOC127701413 n=1 Tax=Mytilus californianus TaxID=6549 RepID=UPI0022483F70|nr:uncharacterized protein LOC127701413 [Mytilus californianus]
MKAFSILLAVLLLTGMVRTGVLSCSIKMCLQLNVDSNQITFICKIDDLHLPVRFYNNHGVEIAYCIVPNPSPECKPIHDYAQIEQYPHKNETVMIVTGTIDKQFNGNWSCHHGGNLHEANVNILKTKDKDDEKDDSRYILLTSGTFIATLALVCCVCLCWKYRKVCSRQRHLNENDTEGRPFNIANTVIESTDMDETSI